MSTESAPTRCGSWGRRGDALRPPPGPLLVSPSASLPTQPLRPEMTRPGLLAWVADGYNGTGLECVLRHTCPPSSFITALGTIPDTAFRTRQYYLCRCPSSSRTETPVRAGTLTVPVTAARCTRVPGRGGPSVFTVRAENCGSSRRLLSTDADSSHVILLTLLLSFESRGPHVGSGPSSLKLSSRPQLPKRSQRIKHLPVHPRGHVRSHCAHSDPCADGTRPCPQAHDSPTVGPFPKAPTGGKFCVSLDKEVLLSVRLEGSSDSEAGGLCA